ncbi:hypothetical protein GQ53DRAFT_713346 [Thozetella sp. PMI_491]|nr:hypothetical protein GQ53DRAFT_713346 [Thozetella sp. PMI_491]
MAESYDLLILTDATASMGHYLRSLNASLPEIIRISSLTGCFDRIGVLAYRDYFHGKLTEWSGWHGEGCSLSQEDLLDFTRKLRPDHGGDWPEAMKTGLAHAHQVMRAEAKTLILVYADAPPHTPATGGKYHENEQKLLQSNAYGSSGPLFLDWISAANTLRDGDKKAIVFSIIQSHLADTLSLHLFLSRKTGGVCLKIGENSKSDFISSLTINVLLTWIGVEKTGAKVADSTKLASVKCYKDASTIESVTSEHDDLSKTYFVKIDNKECCDLVKGNLGSIALSLDTMKRLIPCRAVDGQPIDFSKRYAVDHAYRKVVVKQLEEIIRSDVTAVTVNPVFGSLWRSVCNDRQNEARDRLIELFGAQVNAIVFPNKKAQMKSWLDESYDYAGEILEIIQSVPQEERYPCVFLDPTISFTEVDADGIRNQVPMKFTREELMEIGRSCDNRILRRLGRVLARLTYVSSEADLPDYVKSTPEAVVPRIPMALVTKRHKRKFWKILLHVVLPGTMLAARPAALLAALSLRIGLRPLQSAADMELLDYKTWNNLDIPETWNTNCLALLLEADQNYRERQQDGFQEKESIGFFSKKDRQLFRTLVDYKMLEMNLHTTLTARIGWAPAKIKSPLGPLVTCKECKYPRSVTIMARDGLCGICNQNKEDECTPEQSKENATTNVSLKDNTKTMGSWVECSMTYCRAQYVVYKVDKLNVRAKCWYCRQDGFVPKNHPERDALTNAPCVECSKCLSRIIWPEEYRPEVFKEAEFRCPACDHGRRSTVVDADTSAHALIHKEHNGTGWLLRNDMGKIKEPFNGRSLFHTISTAGTDGFVDQVEVFPGKAGADEAPTPRLTIRGKTIQNGDALITSLRSWVEARRVEAGTCSLCFSDFKKTDLRPACGRRGCGQLICSGCFDGWYGMNYPGGLINPAALTCPFCRRQPTASVLPNALRLLGDLATAMQDPGWIYAWCSSCSMACQFVARACAAGAPPALEAWSCNDCRGVGGIRAARAAKIRNCPGCGVLTEKISGCDHVECTQCHTHWCFFCGKTAEHNIYDHMNEEHGGWYNGGDDEDDGDDEIEYGFVLMD